MPVAVTPTPVIPAAGKPLQPGIPKIPAKALADPAAVKAGAIRDWDEGGDWDETAKAVVPSIPKTLQRKGIKDVLEAAKLLNVSPAKYMGMIRKGELGDPRTKKADATAAMAKAVTGDKKTPATELEAIVKKRKELQVERGETRQAFGQHLKVFGGLGMGDIKKEGMKLRARSQKLLFEIDALQKEENKIRETMDVKGTKPTDSVKKLGDPAKKITKELERKKKYAEIGKITPQDRLDAQWTQLTSRHVADERVRMAEAADEMADARDEYNEKQRKAGAAVKKAAAKKLPGGGAVKKMAAAVAKPSMSDSPKLKATLKKLFEEFPPEQRAGVTWQNAVTEAFDDAEIHTGAGGGPERKQARELKFRLWEGIQTARGQLTISGLLAKEQGTGRSPEALTLPPAPAARPTGGNVTLMDNKRVSGPTYVPSVDTRNKKYGLLNSGPRAAYLNG
jgi:hypothetical protein